MNPSSRRWNFYPEASNLHEVIRISKEDKSHFKNITLLFRNYLTMCVLYYSFVYVLHDCLREIYFCQLIRACKVTYRSLPNLNAFSPKHSLLLYLSQKNKTSCNMSSLCLCLSLWYDAFN